MQLPQLPIHPVLPTLQQALARGSAVLTAPPGSGKTTIVPLALLEQPWLAHKKILILEPRRLTARVAAARMAALLGERVVVGFNEAGAGWLRKTPSWPGHEEPRLNYF